MVNMHSLFQRNLEGIWHDRLRATPLQNADFLGDSISPAFPLHPSVAFAIALIPPHRLTWNLKRNTIILRRITDVLDGVFNGNQRAGRDGVAARMLRMRPAQGEGEVGMLSPQLRPP